jgi:hypothetical protein
MTPSNPATPSPSFGYPPERYLEAARKVLLQKTESGIVSVDLEGAPDDPRIIVYQEIRRDTERHWYKYEYRLTDQEAGWAAMHPQQAAGVIWVDISSPGHPDGLVGQGVEGERQGGGG